MGPLQNRLLQMKDKTFLHMGHIHKIINWKIIGETLHLVTDKNWFEIPIDDVKKTLNDFVEYTEAPKKGNEKMVLYNKLKTSDIMDGLINNFNDIKIGSPNLKKIKAQNDTVNAIMNLVKGEIQIKKLN